MSTVYNLYAKLLKRSYCEQLEKNSKSRGGGTPSKILGVCDTPTSPVYRPCCNLTFNYIYDTFPLVDIIVCTCTL